MNYQGDDPSEMEPLYICPKCGKLAMTIESELVPDDDYPQEMNAVDYLDCEACGYSDTREYG